MNKINITGTSQTATCSELEALSHDYLGIQQSLDDESYGCRAGAEITLPSTITATDGVYNDTKAKLAEMGVTVNAENEWVRILDPEVLRVLKANFSSYSAQGGDRWTEAELATVPYASTFNGNTVIRDLDVLKYMTYYGGYFDDGNLFQYMTSLECVTVPSSFTKWGRNGTDRKFQGCNNLKRVDFNNVILTANQGLNNCSAIEEFVFRKMQYWGMNLNFNNIKKIVVESVEMYLTCSQAGIEWCQSWPSVCPTKAGLATLYLISDQNTPLGTADNPFVIPSTITAFNAYCLYNLKTLNYISYEGTVEQYKAITRGTDWRVNVPCTTIVCSDGTCNIDDVTEA